MSEKEKPCPYCHSVKNEFGTCSWHCLTCANTDGNCLGECNYKHKDDVDDECEGYPDALNPFEKGI